MPAGECKRIELFFRLAGQDDKENEPIQPAKNQGFIRPADRHGDGSVNASFHKPAVDMKRITPVLDAVHQPFHDFNLLSLVAL